MNTSSIHSIPVCLLGCMVLGFPQKEPALPQNPVAKVADAYIHSTFNDRNLDAAATWMHEDIAFLDPTAEVWPGAPAAKGVRGRENFVALQRRWQIAEISFQLTSGFESGPFALRAGKLSWKATGAPSVPAVPFVTVLEVQDGLIASRFDIGDYDELVPGVPSNTEELTAIGAEYLAAYAAFDFEVLGNFFGDDMTFIEAHPSGESVQGRAAVLAYLKGVAASVSDLKLDLKPFVVSFHHILYTGEASFGLDTDGPQVAGGIRQVKVPFWVLLKVVNGEVLEQRDFTGLDHLAACLRRGEQE